MNCECENWARTQSKVATDHHPNCKKYDPEGDARRIIEALIEGIETWSSDTDGIHEACWDAYTQAKDFLYQSLSASS